MKKTLFFLIVISVFAANLININFFPEKNKIDILFSLDSKFSGKVIKIKKNVFLITNISTDKKIKKNFDDYFLKSVIIEPQNRGVLIKINSKRKYTTSVAMTPDGYGLRFRIQSSSPPAQTMNLTNANPQTGLDYFTYVLSLAVLLIIAVILFIFKRKVKKRLPRGKMNVNILFQKPLDPKNRVALIEFNKRKYLVLIGNTNILLDVFDEDMVNIKTQNEFENVLEKNIDKLDNFKQYIHNAEKLKEFDEKI